MSNSSLVTYTSISSFKNSPRNQPITKVTWHHCAGVISLETFDKIVHTEGRDMSANYCIDKDARVGLFCDEGDRSWCSSSAWNDNRAVTIEISNSATGQPWPISDKVYQKAIDLTVDICKRNGIKELTYTGDKNGSLTFHRFFAATGCPETYIFSRANEICAKVNAKLKQTTATTATTTTNTTDATTTSSTKSTNTSTASNTNKTSTTTNTSTSFKKGDLVSISSSAVYYNGSTIPSWVKSQKWYISSISGDRAVLGKNEKGDSDIQSAINTKYLTSSSTFSSYTISLKAGLKIYSSPTNTTKAVGTITSTAKYTIIAEKTVNNNKFGQLKSGAGWVNLSENTSSTTTTTTISKGDKVKVINPIIYGTNKKFTVYASSYTVLEISGNRVVISSDGKNVTAAIDKNNLQKI
jgi:hypothetical protein